MTNQIGADEKSCPMCAETVKAAAVRCRYCGYDFAAARMPASAAPAAPRRRSGGGLSTLLGAAAVVLVIGYLASSSGTKSGSDAAPPRDEALAIMEMRPGAVKVTAAELYQAYEANEAAAQAQFSGRLLEVSGTVAGVDLDIKDDPVVKLAVNNPFDNAHVSLIDAEKSKAAGFAKGQKIIFLCQGIREIIGTPMLSNCIVAERL